jgi:hypothetical protein
LRDQSEHDIVNTNRSISARPPEDMSPKIASITMIASFPDGIELHIKNLKWFFTSTDYHIYIVTLPKMLKQGDASYERVSFITRPTPQEDFVENPTTGFVNFWKWFPAIIDHYNINPEWFLLMEQDLWFFDQFDCVPAPDTIKTFFSEKSNYHNIMLDGRVLQPHLWEGTHLINAAIVRRAIDFKIDFGYRLKSLLERNREHYEKRFGGELNVAMWTGPETLSDFALFCALEERVGWTEVEKAVHLQGPELVHRKYPQLYHQYDEDLLSQVQRELPYMDVYATAAMYYIAGNWSSCRDVKWERAGANLRVDLSKVALRAHEWLPQSAHARLLEVINELTARSTSTGSTQGRGQL